CRGYPACRQGHHSHHSKPPERRERYRHSRGRGAIRTGVIPADQTWAIVRAAVVPIRIPPVLSASDACDTHGSQWTADPCLGALDGERYAAWLRPPEREQCSTRKGCGRNGSLAQTY